MMHCQNRRDVLRGVGTAMALPFLEYFLPKDRALAATAMRRVLYLYIGNGAQWTASGSGAAFTLPDPLSDFTPLKDYVTVVSGLVSKPSLDSRGGDHARGSFAYLTGKTPEFPGPTNVVRSIDLTISDTIGKGLKYPNLCLGADPHSESDSGYSASFTNNISWLGGSNANTKEIDPSAVFDRIFAGGIPGAAATAPVATGKSVIDFVMGEATSLKAQLGEGDKVRLDDYLQSVRELELRLKTPPPVTEAVCTATTRPTRGSYEQNVGLIYDVLYLAFSCGLSNVATYVVASETSSQGYPFIGVPQSHHTVSHDNSPGGYANLAKIVRWHMGKFAGFCQKLKNTPEAGGNMLDNSVFLFGGGMGDGSQHNHVNLPALVVGKGGGAITGGRQIVANGQAYCSLHLALANAAGVKLAQFGDANSPLSLL